MTSVLSRTLFINGVRLRTSVATSNGAAAMAHRLNSVTYLRGAQSG